LDGFVQWQTVDQIDPKEMILPLIVIDVHSEAASNPDYTLSLERMKKWEKDHGQIPSCAFVGDAHGLVEPLAGCRKNGEQGRQRRRSLSWMELARAEISL
jgi:Putative cyclase